MCGSAGVNNSPASLDMLALRNAVLQRDGRIRLLRADTHSNEDEQARNSSQRGKFAAGSRYRGGNDAERAVGLAVDANVVRAVLIPKRTTNKSHYTEHHLCDAGGKEDCG